MNRILIVIDMQEDFVSGVLGSSEAQAVVGPVRDLIAASKAEGASVYYTMDTHPAGAEGEGSDQEAIRIPPHCVKDTDGWQIVSGVKPAAEDVLVEKPGFLSLGLPDAIGPIAPDAVIELCGVCTDICVVSNALYLRARYPDNVIVVHEACCAGTSAVNHEAALSVMRSCLIDVK